MPIPSNIGIKIPAIRLPTGTPVCLIEKIIGASLGGQYLANIWELAGVETEAAPSNIAAIGYNQSIPVAITKRLPPIKIRQAWLIRSAPILIINAPQPIAAAIDVTFCMNKYRPNHALEMPKSSAMRSARNGNTIWQT
jgi:hypothetical protein